MDSNARKDFIFNMWRCQIWDNRTYVAHRAKIESKNIKPPTILKNGPNLDVADDDASAVVMGSRDSANQQISNQSKPVSLFEPYKFSFKSLFFFISRKKTPITAQNTIVENGLETSNKTDALHLPAILGVDSKDQSDEQTLSIKSEKSDNYGNVSKHDLQEIKKIYSKKLMELGFREEESTLQIFEERKSISDEIVDKRDENIQEFKNVGNNLGQYSDEICSGRLEDSENTALKNDLNNTLREEGEILDVTEAMEVGSNDGGNEQFLSDQNSKNNEIISPPNFTEFQICDPEEILDVTEAMEVGSNDGGNEQFLSYQNSKNNEIIFPPNFTEFEICDPEEFGLRNENDTSNKKTLEVNCKNGVNEQDMPAEQSRIIKKSNRNSFQDDNTKELLKHWVPNENEVSGVLDMTKIIERNFNQNDVGIENSKGCGGEQNLYDDQTQVINEDENLNFLSTTPEKDITRRVKRRKAIQAYLPRKKIKRNTHGQSAENTRAGKGMKRTASQNSLQRKRLKQASDDEQGNEERSCTPKQIINNPQCPPPLILSRPLRNRSRPT